MTASVWKHISQQSQLKEIHANDFALGALVRAGFVSEDEVRLVYAVFRKLDTNGDGVLSAADIIDDTNNQDGAPKSAPTSNSGLLRGDGGSSPAGDGSHAQSVSDASSARSPSGSAASDQPIATDEVG